MTLEKTQYYNHAYNMILSISVAYSQYNALQFKVYFSSFYDKKSLKWYLLSKKKKERKPIKAEISLY